MASQRRLPIRRDLLAGILMVGVCGTAAAAEPDWREMLFDGSSLAGCKVDGALRVVAKAGPAGGPAVVFQPDGDGRGSIEIDLTQLKADLTRYDELRFDLLLERGMVDVSVTLWGYPDSSRCRRWFVFKRLPKIGRWDRVALDLDLDDDRSLKKSAIPQRKLVVGFRRPARGGLAAAEAAARIANVRLVRNVVSATIDPRAVAAKTSGGRLVVHHPLRLSNRLKRDLTVAVTVVGETLDRFRPTAATQKVSLPAGRSKTVDVSLWAQAAKVPPTGWVERASVEVRTAEVDGFVAVPIRGCRPVYLYGAAAPTWRPKVARATGAPSAAELEAALDWKLDLPADVTPRYEDFFRCRQCRFRLSVKQLRKDRVLYYCHNHRCTLHKKVLSAAKSDPLYASALGNFHMGSAKLARDLAIASRATGRRDYGAKALDILLAYASVLDRLPFRSVHSTGMYCRLTSATLFEKHPLDDFSQAAAHLRAAGLATERQLETVTDKLLVPLLHSVNLHFYGLSSGQVGMNLATLRGALAARRVWFFADALAGDAGVRQLLVRAFDADGMGLETGAYARRAAQRMGKLAGFLHEVGVDLDRRRLARIGRSTAAGGTSRSGVLKSTGLTTLVHGRGETWRKATINWGASRERGEHDLLTFDLADAKGGLIHETGRIAYASPASHLMYRSLAHNAPVVDQADGSTASRRQEFFHSDDRFAACIVSDRPEAPAFPGCRIWRALVLIDGCLLVADVVRAEQPRTIDLPVCGPSAGRLTLTPAATQKPTTPVGSSKAYRLLGQPRVSAKPVASAVAEWKARGVRLKLHALGNGLTTIAARLPAGFLADTHRDLLLFRRRGRLLTVGALYEVVRDGAAERVRRFEAVQPTPKPPAEGGALAYRITFIDGRSAEVLISLDGRAYRTARCRADAKQRIDVNVSKPRP